jgi:hypothetical protein
LLTRPVQGLRSRQIGEAQGRLGWAVDAKVADWHSEASPGNLAERCRDDGKSVRRTKLLRRFFSGELLGPR